MRASPRNVALPELASPLQVAAAAGIAVLALAVAAAAAGAAPRAPILALTVVAGAFVLLSLEPRVFFVGWFLLAPLLQESASATALGHTLGLALYFGASFVLALWTLTRADIRRLRVLDALPLLYFSYVCIALLMSGEASSVTIKGLYLTSGVGLVLYYFFAVGPTHSITWETILAGMLAATVLEGVMSVADSVTGWNLWHDTAWRVGEPRSVATLSNPAVLGTFLGMGIVLAVGVLVWNGPSRLRVLAILAVAVGLPGLYFTLTRAPFIGTIVAMLLILVSRPNTRLLAVVSCILAVVVLSLSWGRITNSTVYQARVANTGNVQVRFALERWSWKLIAQKPVFGWGYNSFDKAKAQTGLSAQDRARFGTSSTSHNSYLTVLVEYGGLGFLLFAVPWVVIFGRGFAEAIRSPGSRWFLSGVLGAIFVYVLANNAGDFKYFSFVPAVAWALLGVLRRRQLAEV
jgi:O-antigen ligase